MAETTYSIGHSVAKRLSDLYERTVAPPIGGISALRRLEAGKGNEDDMRGWVGFCEAVGETQLADLLRSLTPVGTPPVALVQARMQHASVRLDNALSDLEHAENEGREDLEREAIKRLARALAEHTRALRDLFGAHMEAGR
jgi:hypothetical protein